MTKLFTIYESIQPPDIISPDTEQNYREIQALTLPDNIDEDEWKIFKKEDSDKDSDDWKFFNQKNEQLESVKFESSQLNPDTYSPSQQVIDIARSFVGSRYSWGGANPATGFDCSGLLQYAFKQIGIDIPRTAALQGTIGKEIDLKQSKPGDIIWFGSKNSPSGQHIGLISKIDNGQIYIIDAAGKKLGVVERALPNLQIKSVRRIFKNTNQFANTVINFFKNKGLTENQSRGILGNLMQESMGDHTITNKRSGAFGLAQWLGVRKQKLHEKYGKNPTMEQQLEFIWEELNTTEKKALQKLLNTNTIADATRAFANHYERAGKDEINMNKRINYAHNG